MFHYLSRVGLSLVVVIAFLLHVAGYANLPLVNSLESIAYDKQIALTLSNTKDPRVIIVDIDEKSLIEVGQWPWGRDRLGAIIDNLFDYYKISVLGFDVVFAESDRSSGIEILNNLAKGNLKNNQAALKEIEAMRPKLEKDQIFAKILANRKIAMGYVFKYEGNIDHSLMLGALPAPVMPRDDDKVKKIPFVNATAYTGNLPILQKNAVSGGFFDNRLVDDDGVFRRVPLLISHQNGVYESLALAVTRLALGSPPVGLEINSTEDQQGNELGLEGVLLGHSIRIPVDEKGAVLVPYRGMQGSFPYVSAVDILTKKADPAILKDTIALVGTTAPGLLDLRTTPMQSSYAGVEVHANIISGILDSKVKERPAYTGAIEFLLILTLGLLMTFAPPRMSPTWMTILTMTLIAGNVLVKSYIFMLYNLALPFAISSLLILTLFMLHMSYGFFVESRGKRQLTKLFGQYVPPELVDEMSQRPEQFGLDGESREMTVLFSDVRGFTTISEGLDPQQLTRLMNELLTPMTHIIHKNRGTIDKYMGDAIMAFWGAPLHDSEHARHGVLAGLEMISFLPTLQAAFAAKGWPPVKIGVGLNTGTMNVGNMGSEFRMAYTVLGDAVNLGSRLEGLTKQYGVALLVNETTHQAIPDITCREIDRVRVKGKNEPVIIYEPVGLTASLLPEVTEEIDLYHKALAIYREQQWDEAEAQFQSLKTRAPDRLIYTIYLERIHHFREAPPGDNWDFVFTHTTK